MNQRITGILACIALLFVVDVVEAQYSAEAVAHSKRATRRRTAVVVSSATHAKDEQAAAAQQQSTSTSTTTTEAAPATEPVPDGEPVSTTPVSPESVSGDQAASTTQPAPAPQPVSAGTALPIGTVVTELPGGCETTPVDNVQYYHCGADYYRAAYQGNNLVYVTAEPPK